MSEEAKNERRILVAVDAGDESMYALSWALKNVLLQNSTDTLILLYVKPHYGTCSAFDSIIDDDSELTFSADVTAAIDRYTEKVAEFVLEQSKKVCKDLQNVKLETRLENGDPRVVICDMCKELDADLLVMGSHGNGLSISRSTYGDANYRPFLGSVSNYCSQRVSCPVLIVRMPPKPSATSG
ncbi:hypothetical protein Fmac_006904 [Flemingia macrophylla]|uniref:UspA domain-containing protein n=1 Tax=Flemingia macrophylla TaxID=520843 RepID=A0ABD1NBZ0_9FABA